MKRIIHILVCTCAVSMLSGCATLVLRTTDAMGDDGPKGLYKATRGDCLAAIRFCRSDAPLGWSDHNLNIVERFLAVIFCTIDLPISLVTDTVCFPWDLADRKKGKEAPTTGRTVPPEVVLPVSSEA